MPTSRAYYHSTIADFLHRDSDAVLGTICRNAVQASLEDTQKTAWIEEINLLQRLLAPYNGSGSVYFEYNIPRIGRRIDTVLLIDGVIFILEFKAGNDSFDRAAITQLWDYALDLKNFHEGSHNRYIVPVLVATEARKTVDKLLLDSRMIYAPMMTGSDSLAEIIKSALNGIEHRQWPSDDEWDRSRYCPTPTIIEAACALYQSHSVDNITTNGAGRENLTLTTTRIEQIIEQSKRLKQKSILFVTGVPGAGKTLVGLNMAIKMFEQGEKAVYLSGNFPLVAVLVEALARDMLAKKKQEADGSKYTKKKAEADVRTFIQMIHAYRDECLVGSRVEGDHIVMDSNYFADPKHKKKQFAPIEHVAIFDEAQRAWTQKKIADFMKRKRSTDNFPYSEPGYLISCLDRHDDWAVIICLVGGGQEIYDGEAGISEWLSAITVRYPDWHTYISPELTTQEYAEGQALELLKGHKYTHAQEKDLHLRVSLRSFKAERLSEFIYNLLELNCREARTSLPPVDRYPIYLTRSIDKAKDWLRSIAKGSERFGLLAASTAERLRPINVNVRYKPNEIYWFLNDDNDVRSSNFLEDVATEFQVQGLELDYTAVIWDADLRIEQGAWKHYSFNGGTRWNNINKSSNQVYQKNAYRVLLTRARQGMIIVVPQGDATDQTRLPQYYEGVWNYMRSIGIPVI